MEPEERVAGSSFGDQCRVTPIRVFLVREIGVSELYVLGEEHQYHFGLSASTIDNVPLPSWLHS